MFTLGALMGLFFLSGAALVLPANAVAPTVPEPPTYLVALTAYNAVPEQTDSDPLITASGIYSNPEIVAARSQDLAKELPFGTIIEISGPSEKQNNCGYSIVAPVIGYRIVADSMHSRYTDRIDILFSTKANYTMADGKIKNASAVLGSCRNAKIRVVGFVNLLYSNRVPKTQAELAILIKGDSIALK